MEAIKENTVKADNQMINSSELSFLGNKAAKTDEVNEGAVLSEEKWGYGESPDSEEGFLKRFEELVELISKNKKLSGVCYTQLYDIEQEQNGFYTYDRKNKFSPEIKQRIKKANDKYYIAIKT